jgi:hypothetical protein
MNSLTVATNFAENRAFIIIRDFLQMFKKKNPGRLPGGTQNVLLTVASFRTWRGSKGSAAPDPPGRAVGYLKQVWLSIRESSLCARKG